VKESTVLMPGPEDQRAQEQRSTSLPEELSARVDSLLDRLMATLREQWRTEIRRMFEFAGKDDIEAAVIVLKENGGPMPLEEVAKELLARGIWREPTGAKGSSAEVEIKRSLGQAARHAVSIKFVDRDKQILGLV
jgi:hypothetical protein